MLANTAMIVFAESVAGDAAALKIQDFLTQFIGPILLLGIGIIAIKFLMQRQMTQFFQFLAIAVLVGVLFFQPTVVKTIATWLGNMVQSWFGG